jgi:hypothetical protein
VLRRRFGISVISWGALSGHLSGRNNAEDCSKVLKMLEFSAVWGFSIDTEESSPMHCFSCLACGRCFQNGQSFMPLLIVVFKSKVFYIIVLNWSTLP